jgi:hypothetical protein
MGAEPLPKSYKNEITEYNDPLQRTDQSTAREVLTILAPTLQRSTNSDLLTGPGHRTTDPGRPPAGGGQSEPFKNLSAQNEQIKYIVGNSHNKCDRLSPRTFTFSKSKRGYCRSKEKTGVGTLSISGV